MKTKIYNYLLLVSGAAFLLIGCDPPEKKTPELNNQISFDGQIYNITAAGTSVDDAVYLYFKSGEDVWTDFGLNLGEGVFRITESGTFTFDEASDGMPGTFSDGWFETDETEAEVISGKIVIEISGSKYTVKVDCKCEGGKDLTIRYTGALEYDGPTGTTTFEIGDVTFPYAYAFIYPSEVDSYYGRYTDIEIYALDGTEDTRMLACYLSFFHSETTLAGTYTCRADEPLGAGFVFGDLYADGISENENVGGYLSEGTVTVEIEGDVYTITFEDVKIYNGIEFIDVTGTYTGTMLPRPDEE